MLFIGIDPGLNGGIAFIGDDNTSAGGRDNITLFKTPVIAMKEYDIQAMKSLLLSKIAASTIGIATIENQISMPGQGLTSTLQTGKGFGIWLGLLAGLEIPYQVVQARKWQNKMFSGTSPKLDTKARSEIVAKRLFPTTDFRKSERAYKADDGLTDAACISEYGKRTYSNIHVEHSGIEHKPLNSTEDICSVCGKYIPGDVEGCFNN